MQSTVLIIDDDRQFRRLVAELLVARGYRVVGEAGSAEEGLALAAALRPDAVLLDGGPPAARDYRVQAASVLLEALRQPVSLIHRSRSFLAVRHSTRP